MICARCGEHTRATPCASCGADPRLAGRYALEREIGRSASGRTWYAVGADGHPVAVKEHRPGPVDVERAVGLLRREAATLAALDTPGVPRWVDHFAVAGDEGPALFLVQAWVDGPTLDMEGRLGRDETLDVLEQLLALLGRLHARGLAHGDVKPKNLVRSARGLALVDFGALRQDLSEEPGLAGTLGYLAPEQASGPPTPRSDLYAAGATAVALLTGHEPHALLGPDGRMRWELHIAVDPSYRALLDALLDPDPERRPVSAEDALGRLRAVRAERALDADPAPAREPRRDLPAPPPSPAPEQTWAPFGMGASLGFVALALLALAMWALL